MFNARGRDQKNMKHAYVEPPKPREIDMVITDPSSGKVYNRGRFLGKGGFAKCYELIDQETNKVYAGKIVSKTVLTKPHQKEKMSLEIAIHRSLRNEHVVDFHGFFEDNNYVYVLLELCRRRSLMELHKRRRVLTEPEVKYYMRQIVLGCQYLHRTKIIHRDLKLGNLFLNDDMEVKIGDFGLATKLDDIGERKKTLCGTPNYIAPEVLAKKGHSFEVDVWSLGCILYTLLAGKPPFETSCLKDTYMRIKHNDYIIPSRISYSAQQLIMKLLQPDPAKRPTMNTILDFEFFKTGYIPSRLPISCLTTAPRFAVADRASIGVPRKPLLELNAKEAALSGVPAPGAKDRRISHAVHVCDGISTFMGPQEMAAKGIKDDDDEDKEPQDCWLSDLKTQLASWKKDVVPEPKINNGQGFDEAEDPASVPVYWVSKWVDYTDKYGLGYQLSDNSVGVLYNDQTRLLLAEDGENLQYIGRDGAETFYTMENFPRDDDDIQKKVKLMVYFRNYMNQHLLKAGGNRTPKDGDESTRLPFLRTWFRTKNAIVLHLSNGILQINIFQDHTKIILCPKMGAVTYIDENKNFRTFPLKKIERSGCCKELISRLRYAHSMVERLQNPATSTAVTSAQSVMPKAKPQKATARA